MKQSIYNNRIGLSEHTDVIYNSLSEEFIIVTKNLNLNEPIRSEKLWNELVSKKILVKDSIDERGIVSGTYNKAVNNNSGFKLIINPTLNCNFRCWYCYESHLADTKMDTHTISSIKNAIKELMSIYPKFELSFFGGEPFLEFNSIVLPLIEFVDHVSQELGTDYIITFTTNGFLITEEIVNRLKPYKIGLSQITLDGGPEYHNVTRKNKKANTFAMIVSNIKRLIRANMPVVLRINATKENIRSAFEIPLYFNDLKDNEKMLLQILVQQVWQDAKNDILDSILELYEEFIKIGIAPWHRRFNYITDICYGDSAHSCVINYDGKIFKCTALDFDKKYVESEITADGKLNFKDSFFRKLELKKKNPNCINCRIRPICNGGCYKTVLQAKDEDYCLYKTDEEKDTLIRNLVKEQLFLMKFGLSWKTNDKHKTMNPISD